MIHEGDGYDISFDQFKKMIRGSGPVDLDHEVCLYAQHPLPLTYPQWEILCMTVSQALAGGRGKLNGFSKEQVADVLVKFAPDPGGHALTIAKIWLEGDPETLENLVAIPEPSEEDRDEDPDWHDMLSVKPTKDFIEDVIPQESIILLYGTHSTAKSFVAIDWAYSVASGQVWSLLPGSAVIKSPVVYIALEGQAGIRNRILAWVAAHGGEDPNVRWRGHLYMEKDGNNQAWDLRDGFHEGKLALARKINRLPKVPRLVIFDTLADALTGGNENLAQDMGQFISAAKYLIAHANCSVLIIHHENAQGGMRGSTRLPASCDVVLRSEAVESSPGLFRISWVKSKEGQEQDPILFELDQVQTEKMNKTSAVAIPPLRGLPGRVFRAMKRGESYSTRQLETILNKGLKAGAKVTTRARITECLEKLKEWGRVEGREKSPGKKRGWKRKAPTSTF